METRSVGTADLAGRLELRAYRGEDDLAEIVRIDNAESEAESIPGRVSLGGLRAEYAHPNEHFDPAADVTIAQVDGAPVGYGTVSWIDTTDAPLREYRLGGAVDPAWRRRGVGTALLARNERRARELAGVHDTDRQSTFGAFSAEGHLGRVRLLEGAGYRRVRWFFDMVRPTLDDVPDVPLPDGIEVRPITPDLYRRVWAADVEAFRDHWGGFDDSDAALQRWIDSPEFDPALWVVAFDGDEVAAGVINGIYPEENAALDLQRGWLDSVFTRRAWRRRGLARALITRSLALLRERGMTSAALGVDADNPSGALGLYQSAGFEVSMRYAAWRKPFAAAP